MRIVRDSLVVAWRNILRIRRTPQLIVFATIQPVMFVLLFTYVFGGSIPTPGLAYVDYLVPGILVQTAAFGSSSTAIGLADDLKRGMVDRFRSLPMARAAFLGGRTIADLARAIVVVTMVLLIGFLVGFRPDGSVLYVAGGVLLVLALGFAMSWLFACLALLVKDPEAAATAGFIPLFPFVFASSIFTRTSTMPDWLASFADQQPLTRVCNAVRGLMIDGSTADVLPAVLWIFAILAVFAPTAVVLYRRT
jgi:ABC-2 type transport system permease protein/oleandomycin transport system permease protein